VIRNTSDAGRMFEFGVPPASNLKVCASLAVPEAAVMPLAVVCHVGNKWPRIPCFAHLTGSANDPPEVLNTTALGPKTWQCS
jgi:hypothetical protein